MRCEAKGHQHSTVRSKRTYHPWGPPVSCERSDALSCVTADDFYGVISAVRWWSRQGQRFVHYPSQVGGPFSPARVSRTVSMPNTFHRGRKQQQWWIWAVGRVCSSWLRNVSGTPLRPSCRGSSLHRHPEASSHLQPPFSSSSLVSRRPRCRCIPHVRGWRAGAASRRSCGRPFAPCQFHVSPVRFRSSDASFLCFSSTSEVGTRCFDACAHL